MAVTWTKEQQKVISLRDRNILVSAAAGSGKTAVLVQRILSKITDPVHPTDIDRLLIMTFTRAAAGEMKERISKALEKALYEDPENDHLQRQMTLIHTAQITTIDGFCSWLIRNYFHLIDLDPGYRVADEGELKLLREDVLKQLIEECYADSLVRRDPSADGGEAASAPDGHPDVRFDADNDFLKFVECYASGKTDDILKDYILEVYDAAMSNPYPEEWLQEALKLYQAESVEELREAPWMALMWQTVAQELEEAVRLLQEAQELCRKPGGPYLYEDALDSDLLLIRTLQKIAGDRDYNAAAALLADLSFARLSSARTKDVEPSLKEEVKNLREEEKDIVKELSARFFTGTEEQLLETVRCCLGPMETLVRLTRRFMEAFSAKKREKNILDFTDMEHFALQILMKKEEDGTVRMSEAAQELSAKYDEVLVDEYQDSNLVQELLTTCVSGWADGRKNVFMVGDVKQSIYRFRLARPELFMEKYRSYALEDAKEQRIDLHKNFRSRPEVLSAVNMLFYQLMGEDLGGITYDASAALYPGAEFPDRDGGQPESAPDSGNGAEKTLPDPSETWTETEVLLVEKDGEELQEEQNLQNARELEALALGHRIREIVGKEQVLDKDSGKYRPAEYGDIAVLLRTSAGWAESFSQVFDSLGIPSYTASRSGYFSAMEVVTVLNYLRICDNPIQDIPMAGVLRSPIVGLTAQELAQLRAGLPKGQMYECVLEYLDRNGGQPDSADDPLAEKLTHFLQDLKHTRDLAEFTPIHELIAFVLQRTGYGKYVRALPGGEQRSANLQMLVEKAMDYEKTSYRGLFNFVRYIENLQKYEVDFGEVNLSGAGMASVQIMTIHKSKGLEFPIVFLAGMGKQFNFSDVRAPLLIHPDIGLGADAIFPKKRMIVQTLPKQVIRRELLKENLGEELRVLYVALTRAKEKLIMTGTIGNLEKQIQYLSRFRDMKERLLPIAVRMRAKTYWDFVLPALARHSCMDELFLSYGKIPASHTDRFPEGKTDHWGNPSSTDPDRPDGGTGEASFRLRVITAGDLVEEEIGRQVDTQLREETLKNWDPQTVYDPSVRELLESRFSYEYPYTYLREIPTKVSVSELKKRSYSDGGEQESTLYVEHDIVPLIPKFIAGEQEEVYTGAARGTAYHRVMECLDYHQVSGRSDIVSQIRMLSDQQKMTEQEAACVRPEDILKFLDTPLGERMRIAGTTGKLFREQPFVISERASRLDKRWNGEETVLVQGIIDAYFQEGEDIVLVDYKTDKVPDGNRQYLADLYHIQLEDYAEALERMTGRRVKEKYIYSFTLGEEILLK